MPEGRSPKNTYEDAFIMAVCDLRDFSKIQTMDMGMVADLLVALLQLKRHALDHTFALSDKIHKLGRYFTAFNVCFAIA